MVTVDDDERRNRKGLKGARRHREPSTSRLERPLAVVHAGGRLRASGGVGRTTLGGGGISTMTSDLGVFVVAPLIVSALSGLCSPETLFPRLSRLLQADRLHVHAVWSAVLHLHEPMNE